MQLEFLWRDKPSFESELQRRMGGPLHVTVTDNSSSILSFREGRNGHVSRLRIHRMFLAAEPKVLDALITWMTKRRSRASADVLDSFIKEHEHLIQAKESPVVSLITRGNCFDLGKLYNEINRVEFENTIMSRITWGRMPPVRRRHSIRLGSYTPEDDLIRVHPLLDQAFVPEYFVRYIVFHEMLHAHLGIERGPGGRRRIHTPEFNRREREYPDFERAIAWHNDPKNLQRLLKTPRFA